MSWWNVALSRRLSLRAKRGLRAVIAAAEPLERRQYYWATATTPIPSDQVNRDVAIFAGGPNVTSAAYNTAKSVYASASGTVITEIDYATGSATVGIGGTQNAPPPGGNGGSDNPPPSGPGGGGSSGGTEVGAGSEGLDGDGGGGDDGDDDGDNDGDDGGLTGTHIWWSNKGGLAASDMDSGVDSGFVLLGLPHMGTSENGNMVTLYNGDNVVSYDLREDSDGVYVPRSDDTGRVRVLALASRDYIENLETTGDLEDVLSPEGDQAYFVWEGANGVRMYFDAESGQYRGQTDQYGNETTVVRNQSEFSAHGIDAIVRVDRWAGVPTLDASNDFVGTNLDRVTYDYTSNGYSAGSIQFVRPSARHYLRFDGTSMQEYRFFTFEYYGGNKFNGDSYADHTNGFAGDVKFIKSWIPGSGTPQLVDTSYFRYDTSSNDYSSNAYSTLHTMTGQPMAMVYDSDAFARLVHDHPTSYDSGGARAYPEYASTILNYTGDRVSSEVTAGAAEYHVENGTDTGQGTTTYASVELEDTSGSVTYSVNQPVQVMHITRHDHTEEFVYLNAAGQTLIDQVWNSQTYSSGLRQDWVTAYEYDDQDRLVRIANPSAVTRYESGHYVGTTPFYVNTGTDVGTGNALFVITSTTGLIDVREFNGTNVASDSSQNLIKAVKISQGDNTSYITLSDYTYTTRIGTDSNSNEFRAFLPSTSNSYPIAGSNTDKRATTNSYTYSTNTFTPSAVVLAPSVVDTQLPAISNTHHGDNTSSHFIRKYDSLGHRVMLIDGGGITSSYTFDNSTNMMLSKVVDTAGLGLTTTYQGDLFGRVTRIVSPEHQGSFATYIVYNDPAHEYRVYSGWNLTSSGAGSIGPVKLHRTDRANGWTDSLTYAPTAASVTTNVSTGAPLGTESISNIQSFSRTMTNISGQVFESDRYFSGIINGTAGYTFSNLLTNSEVGSANVNFYSTTYGYDATGQLDRETLPTGTIYQVEHDLMGRPTAYSTGTNAGISTSNMRVTNDIQYDGGGIGDSNVTAYRQYIEYNSGTSTPTLSTARISLSAYDWRNRLVWQKEGALASATNTNSASFALDPIGEKNTTTNTWVGQQGYDRPLIYYTYDNLDEALTAEVFNGSSVSFTGTDTPSGLSITGKRYAETTWSYDDWGRVFSTKMLTVSASGVVSAATNALTSDVWFDARGKVTKQNEPNSPGYMYTYDGAGRLSGVYAVLPSDVRGTNTLSSSTVYEQMVYTYDKDGNVLLTTDRQRFHNGSGTGTLAASGTAGNRAYFTQYFYDNLDRLTVSANIGTDNGTNYAGGALATSALSGSLTNSYSYNVAGWVSATRDGMGFLTTTLYDLAGRVTDTYENDTVGPTLATNTHTSYAYDGSDHVVLMTAYQSSGADQKTGFVYGVGSNTGSGSYASSAVFSNDLLYQIQHPIPDGTNAGTAGATASLTETYGYNAQGETTGYVDRNGSWHVYSYDEVGRLRADRVNFAASGVNTAILAFRYDYDNAGRLSKAVSVTNGSSLDGLLIAAYAGNTVVRTYDGLGNVTSEKQKYGTVTYTYSQPTSSSNQSLLTGQNYGQESVTYDIDALGRTTAVNGRALSGSGSIALESYEFLGLSSVVSRLRTEIAGGLQYYKLSGEATNAVTGDQYTGLDTFGRVKDQRWMQTVSSTLTDKNRVRYLYDKNSNVVAMENATNIGESAKHGVVYSYDGLNRLASFSRETVTFSGSNYDTITTTGSVTRSQTWTLDSLGNWGTVTTNGSAVTRSHDSQDRLTTVVGTGSLTYDLTYDNNGNQTKDEHGTTNTYDGWNRLVLVHSGSADEGREFDAMGRLILTDDATNTTEKLVSVKGQTLVDLVVVDGAGAGQGGSYTQTAYVWSPLYVNGLIARDIYSPTEGGGGGDDLTEGGGETSSFFGGPTALIDIGAYGQTLTERTYAEEDINWNVTATLRGTYDQGTTVTTWDSGRERYEVDPYGGNVIVLNDNFTVKGSGNGTSDRAWNDFFQGGFTDATTGLIHFGAREYDPNQGRWKQQDPAGWPDGPNRYLAVGDSPLLFVDPTGLEYFPPLDIRRGTFQFELPGDFLKVSPLNLPGDFLHLDPLGNFHEDPYDAWLREQEEARRRKRDEIDKMPLQMTLPPIGGPQLSAPEGEDEFERWRNWLLQLGADSAEAITKARQRYKGQMNEQWENWKENEMQREIEEMQRAEREMREVL